MHTPAQTHTFGRINVRTYSSYLPSDAYAVCSEKYTLTQMYTTISASAVAAIMEPKKKNTLIGIMGGVFAACYSNAVRHEPMMKSMWT